MKEFLKDGKTVGHINQDVSICVHSYADAKKSPKMSENLKKYSERWDKLGFTEGFPDDRKEELSYAFEQLAVFLVFCEENQTDRLFKDENKYFETVGFPMVRRVLGNLEPNEFDFQKFLKYCKIFNVCDVIEELNKLALGHEYDKEAEGCAVACDMIEKKYKNPNMDNESIKKESYDKINKMIEEKRKEKDDK